MYDRFYPGQPWLDTNGNRIQAHGGSVIVVDGVYYWYGENKEFTTGNNGMWTMGIRCYSSTDLYNWKDEGLIIPPDESDPDSPLHPSARVDRPHIVFNPRTKKFVCWVKLQVEKDGSQASSVLIADHILGPYTMVHKNFYPLGMSAGDFDLVVAPDGKGYYFFERVHSEIICADLTDDFTDVTGYYSAHFPQPYPPYVREAPAHFVRDYKHYLITSGTSGLFPNPSEIAVGNSWHGPYKVLGDPHPDDHSRTSWHTQVTSVLKVPGKKDLYIALADRWLPDLMHVPYDWYAEMFECAFTGKPLSQKTAENMKNIGIDSRMRNTSLSDYVWLPIVFDGEIPTIPWRDSWSLDEFEDE